MSGTRYYPTNCALANGEQLVLAGSLDDNTENTLPQVWTTTGGWRNLTSALKELPLYPWTHVAPNGRVFVSGPKPTSYYLDTAGTGAWTTVRVTKSRITRWDGTAVMYGDGKVLIVGGGTTPSASAEVINLQTAAPAWRLVSSIGLPARGSHCQSPDRR